MKYYVDENLTNFNFWGQAKSNVNNYLTYDDLDELDTILEDILTEPTDTEINDLFAYDFDYICTLLGKNTFLIEYETTDGTQTKEFEYESDARECFEELQNTQNVISITLSGVNSFSHEWIDDLEYWENDDREILK